MDEEAEERQTKREFTYTGIGLESLRDLYLAERQRRETVRGQLAVPVSIVSFSIFGYVSFAQYFDILKFDTVTLIIDGLMIASLSCLFLAMIFLARVELVFMRVEVGDLEDLREADSEYDYFRGLYSRMSQQNIMAARQRGRSFLLLLLALGCFVAAVVLLPLHLRESGIHGRGGSASASQPALTEAANR